MFSRLHGVVATSVGYAGGTSAHPTYRTVCAGDGHTEVVAVEFDPARISYERLLEVFLREHDATIARKAQYRSVVFYTTPAQGAAARAALARASRRPATAVEPAGPYWPAEEYHQRYLAKRRQIYGR